MQLLWMLLRRIEDGLNAVMERVAFAALVAMLVVITMQIVCRVFFQALAWSEEVARYLLVWITFLGATIAFKHGRHIAVTFAVDALPGPWRKGARILAVLASITFFVVVARTGYAYMSIQSFQVSASLRLPMSYIYAVIPFSAATMFLYAVSDALDLIFDAPDKF